MGKLQNQRDHKDHESKIKAWRRRRKVNYEGKNWSNSNARYNTEEHIIEKKCNSYEHGSWDIWVKIKNKYAWCCPAREAIPSKHCLEICIYHKNCLQWIMVKEPLTNKF